MGKNVTKLNKLADSVKSSKVAETVNNICIRISDVKKFIRTREFRKALFLILAIIVIVILTNLPAKADTDVVVGIGPGEACTEEKWVNTPEHISTIYLNIPLSAEEVDLMARMAMSETMWHDGTCPDITVKACYEVVFNRYLYDLANNDHEYHRKNLSISSIMTKSGEFSLASKTRFNALPDEAKNAYRNMVWQVHNQGPTVLIPQSNNGYTNTDYKYWQSRKGYGGRDKDNVLWVGWIYNDAGEIVPGVIPYAEKWRLVGTVRGLSYLGNWYRINYK